MPQTVDPLTLPAGRELDAEVALIMGWERRPEGRWTNNATRQWSVDASFLPRWSTSIKAAWAVVEKMQAEGYYGSVAYDTNGFVNASFFREEDAGGAQSGPCKEAPLAIVRAALAAKAAT